MCRALYPVTSLLRISANDFVQREVEVLKTFNSYVNFIYAFSVHNNIGMYIYIDVSHCV